MADDKTNVMRLLDSKKIPYNSYSYPHGEDAVDGITVASLINKPVEQVYKTLVTIGSDKKINVFVIPVSASLNLKKAAKTAGEKSIEMIKVSQIKDFTGYIRGGCSPIGMKKLYTTIFDESALKQDTIIVSGGKIGSQVELPPQVLASLCKGQFFDIID